MLILCLKQVGADRSETGFAGANVPVEANRILVQRPDHYQSGPELFGNAAAQ